MGSQDHFLRPVGHFMWPEDELAGPRDQFGESLGHFMWPSNGFAGPQGYLLGQ